MASEGEMSREQLLGQPTVRLVSINTFHATIRRIDIRYIVEVAVAL
jgi:hypothetical protein